MSLLVSSFISIVDGSKKPLKNKKIKRNFLDKVKTGKRRNILEYENMKWRKWEVNAYFSKWKSGPNERNREGGRSRCYPKKRENTSIFRLPFSDNTPLPQYLINIYNTQIN